MYSLYYDYRKFERIVNNYDGSDVLDASKNSFLAPTTLIPLLCFIRENPIKFIKLNDRTEDYVSRILNGKKTSTTTPYTILPNTSEERANNGVASNIAEKINYNTYGGKQSIYHVCNELISNVYDHTPFEKGYANQGYTYAQEYPKERKLDICVMDDGLSIPGKFEMHSVDFSDDCEAIYKAINHFSTEKEDSISPRYSRGNGLWSTLRLVIDGNQGSALIVSRNGCLHIRKKDSYKYYHLDNSNIFSGTLVSLRFKDNLVPNFYELNEIDDKFCYKY